MFSKYFLTTPSSSILNRDSKLSYSLTKTSLPNHLHISSPYSYHHANWSNNLNNPYISFGEHQVLEVTERSWKIIFWSIWLYIKICLNSKFIFKFNIRKCDNTSSNVLKIQPVAGFFFHLKNKQTKHCYSRFI